MSTTEPTDRRISTAPEALDPACVRAFFWQRFTAVERVDEIGRGEWSVACGFRTGEDDLVARFGPEREDFEKDRFAGRWSVIHTKP